MILTKYIRDKKGRLKGCVVLTDEDNFGYSLCHPLDEKKNNKKLARKIAIGRAEKTTLELPEGTTTFYLHRRKSINRTAIPATVIPYLRNIRMEMDKLSN